MGLARGIDRFSHGLGILTGLITLLMIGVGLFNVIGRFVDRYAGTALSSNSLLEAQWYLFSAVFLIGGADGLDPTLVASAQGTLAFGPQTWPHALARSMLCEQIYRAVSILAGSPYHRD